VTEPEWFFVIERTIVDFICGCWPRNCCVYYFLSPWRGVEQYGAVLQSSA
jgi:hypothetical protein